jgi:hypothetical protein
MVLIVVPLSPTKHSFSRKVLILLMRPIGLEPMAYCLGGSRSIHLSYGRVLRWLRLRGVF